MDGYKIVYNEPDGTTTATFLGEPVTNISLPKQCYMEVIKLLFGSAHPGCEIVSVERCSLEKFKK